MNKYLEKIPHTLKDNYRKPFVWFLAIGIAFLLVASPVFYPLKYAFIRLVEIIIVKRPLTRSYWMSFMNIRLVAVALFCVLVSFYLYLSRKGKVIYFFPAFIAAIFLWSNIYAMRNGFDGGYSNTWNFGDFVFAVGGYAHADFFGTNYPPLAVGIFKLMYAIVHDDSIAEFAVNYLLTLYFFFTVLMLFTLFVRFMKDGQKYKFLIAGCFFMTGPLLFAYQRMNLMHLALIFTMIFVLWNDSPNKWKKGIALVSLAVAAGIKYFPAIFGLMLIKQKRWRDTAVCLSVGVCMLLPFLLMTEGGIASLKQLLENLYSFAINPHTLTSVSTEAIAYRTAVRMGVSSPETIKFIMRFSLIIFLAVSVVSFFFAKDRHSELLVLSMIAILTPISSAWYGLIFLFIPFLELVKKESFTLLNHIEFILYNLTFIFVLNGKFMFLMPSEPGHWRVILLYFVAVFEIFWIFLKNKKISENLPADM